MLYSIKIGEQTYSVEIEDLRTRPVKVTVDGEVIEVWPDEKPVARQISTAAPDSMRSAEENPCPPTLQPQAGTSPISVTAPIPGVIIEITVSSGQSVKRGDTLCVLEAMKMKNLIRAGRSGVIAGINVNTGDQVRHGQTLMEFSE